MTTQRQCKNALDSFVILHIPPSAVVDITEKRTANVLCGQTEVLNLRCEWAELKLIVLSIIVIVFDKNYNCNLSAVAK